MSRSERVQLGETHQSKLTASVLRLRIGLAVKSLEQLLPELHALLMLFERRLTTLDRNTAYHFERYFETQFDDLKNDLWRHFFSLAG